MKMKSPYRALEIENEKLREEIRYLKQSLNEDGFTMTYNRRYFMERLERACSESQSPFAVSFIDVDGLKNANDRYGHAAGDEILLQVAHMLSAAIEDGDILARMGGDEFAILMHGAGGQDVASLTERILDKIHSIDFQIDGQKFSISVSVGISSGKKGSIAADILAQADQSMYSNKKQKTPKNDNDK